MKKILLAMTVVVFVSGCSVFMPYHESFECTLGEGEGYCGSLSDVYEYSVRVERGSK